MTQSLTTEELSNELECLRQKIEELAQEKNDLEILLQTIIEHSDQCEALLESQTQAALQEKNDLEILLETTTQHSDKITAVLHDKAVSAARESERRLAQFLEAVPVGVFVVDTKGNPYYANKMAQKILGEPRLTTEDPQPSSKSFLANQLAQQILNTEALSKISVINNQPYYAKHIAQQVFGESNEVETDISKLSEIYRVYLAGTEQLYPVDRLPIVRALRGEQATVDDIEIHRDNTNIPLEIWATPIFGEDKEVLYAIEVFQDISQRRQAEAERIRFIQEREAKNAALRLNKQLQQEIQERQRAENALQKANQKLQRLATLDGLTQVANRRRLDEYLQQAWRRLTEEQAEISFILCDVDFFKLYNDTYGHQAGDDCLQKIAQAISRAVRRSEDLVARYGGEEFSVTLLYTNGAGALQVATTMQEEIARLAISHETSTVSGFITLSIGIATMILIPDQRVSPTTLINIADNALYEAKANGRNQIVLREFEPIHLF